VRASAAAVARHTEQTKQGTLPTHCFLLECPPSNISQVVKPTAKAKRCQPRLWVLLAWKPSLRWNESCCTGAKVQTSSPVSVPHGWLYAQLSMASRTHDERRGVMVSQHNSSSTSFFTSTTYGIQPSIYVLERCPRAFVQAD